MTRDEMPFDLNPLLYQLPYGPGLWNAVQEWPNEALSKLNIVTNVTEFSCDGDWLLYVETLLPALGDMFLVLLDFGWDDVARGFFRPSGIRTRWKFRPSKKKGRRFRFEIPELGESIGKLLPGAKFFRGRRVGPFWRWFWRIDGLAQRALWYWLLVDVGVDLAYNWTTGIFRHERCWRVADGWFQAGPGFLSTPCDGVWYQSGAPVPHRSGGGPPAPSFPVAVPPGMSATVMYGLDDVRFFLNTNASIACSIYSESTGREKRSPEVIRGALDDVVPLTIGRFGPGEVVGARIMANSDRADTAFVYKGFAAVKLHRG